MGRFIYTDKERARILSLMRQGLGTLAIRERTGMSLTTIRRIAREEQLKDKRCTPAI